MGGKAGSGPADDREMQGGTGGMKRGMKSDGRRRREGWRSGVTDRQGRKTQKGLRQKGQMMNREHGEAIKSPVDSCMTARS